MIVYLDKFKGIVNNLKNAQNDREFLIYLARWSKGCRSIIF